MRVPLVFLAIVGWFHQSIAQTCTSAGPVFAHPGDPTYYTKCLAAGVGVKLKCPPGQYFSVSACITGVAPPRPTTIAILPTVKSSETPSQATTTPTTVLVPTAPTVQPPVPSAPSLPIPKRNPSNSENNVDTDASISKPEVSSDNNADSTKNTPGSNLTPPKSPAAPVPGNKDEADTSKLTKFPQPATEIPTPATKSGGSKLTTKRRKTTTKKSNLSKQKTTPASKDVKNRKKTAAPKRRKAKNSSQKN